MAIRRQDKFPEISALGRQSPMISNLPFDHQAWIHPMQSYIWMHNLYLACTEIFEIEMPLVQIKRLDLMEIIRFLEDHSGRSTGKTFNYLVAFAIILICMNLQEMIWLGQEREIGIEIFDKYFDEWIEYNDNFRRFVTAKGKHKPKVSHTQSGATVRFHNGSRARSLSPDPRKDYKKMQSWRFNHGIFNEWTSWPYIHEIPDKVEPIFTNTNYQYRQTRQFREAMEQVLGAELGRLTNEYLYARHKVQDYIPRDYIKKREPLPWPQASEAFYENFEICFGFDYRKGMNEETLQFEEITRPADIAMFFKDWDEGDPIYFNKLVYDGSAKRPSEDCHWFHKMIKKRVESEDKLYSQYRIGIDDIPVQWDGIIYDSTIVEKARKELLAEDFQRIWLGMWIEGRSKKPFSWAEVVGACKEGWLGQLSRRDEIEIFLGGIDSAQGTDATFKTTEGIKDGRDDDGVTAIFKLGDGTALNPHKLCRVKIAEDIRSEPMAFDIQSLEAKFGVMYYMLDPGGGGKSVLEKLAKRALSKIDITGETEAMEVIPMLPWDHGDPQDGKTNICIFSLSNEMITAVHVDSKTGKALLHYEDQLNNCMVRLMQDALRDKAVVFPQYLEPDEIVELYNSEKINDEELSNLYDMRRALSQMTHLNYVTDRNGKRVVTSHGVFKYDAPGKKDAAWAVLMGYMMCDIIIRMKKIQESAGYASDMCPDVE